MTRTLLKHAAIWAFLALVLTISVAYAADSGYLGLDGTVFVQPYDEDTGFRFFPVPDANGLYFTSTNMPAGLRIGDQSWVGDVFHLTILKTNQGNNANNQFTLAFNFVNRTPYPWQAGTVEVLHVYTSSTNQNDSMFKQNPTFSAPAVGPDQQSAITMTFTGKINDNVTDAIMFKTTYRYTNSAGVTVEGPVVVMIEFRGVDQPPYTGWPQI